MNYFFLVIKEKIKMFIFKQKCKRNIIKIVKRLVQFPNNYRIGYELIYAWIHLMREYYCYGKQYLDKEKAKENIKKFDEILKLLNNYSYPNSNIITEPNKAKEAIRRIGEDIENIWDKK